MTCAHVLGLIDAGPFADYPRAHLEAAWQHARKCATCGPALEAATVLTAELPALPQPAPPADLAAAVVARIAFIEERDTAPARAVVPAVIEDTRRQANGRNWSAWLTMTGGLAAGLAILLSGAQIRLAPPGLGGTMAGLVAMPSPAGSALVLVACLAVYLAGLFAPLKQAAEKRPPELRT